MRAGVEKLYSDMVKKVQSEKKWAECRKESYIQTEEINFIKWSKWNRIYNKKSFLERYSILYQKKYSIIYDGLYKFI